MYNMLVKMKICRKRAIVNEPNSELSCVTIGTASSQDDKRRRWIESQILFHKIPNLLFLWTFFHFHYRQKALKELAGRLNKELPRVVGNVVPQKPRIQSPHKKVEITASPNSAFVATEREPFLAKEQNIESDIIEA